MVVDLFQMGKRILPSDYATASPVSGTQPLHPFLIQLGVENCANPVPSPVCTWLPSRKADKREESKRVAAPQTQSVPAQPELVGTRPLKELTAPAGDTSGPQSDNTESYLQPTAPPGQCPRTPCTQRVRATIIELPSINRES